VKAGALNTTSWDVKSSLPLPISVRNAVQDTSKRMTFASSITYPTAPKLQTHPTNVKTANQAFLKTRKKNVRKFMFQIVKHIRRVLMSVLLKDVRKAFGEMMTDSALLLLKPFVLKRMFRMENARLVKKDTCR
jgi:hypothetical protein